ncbi:MAG TPA: hypothetical protein DEB40_12615 [Elusimicrobia bacterium]|nr:hypothetical protein [Elusimicrobiota bacterium]HBT62576.1 hypothetical protein [Elusimicrobiota bacterium]
MMRLHDESGEAEQRACWTAGLAVFVASLLNFLFYNYNFGTDPHIVQVLPFIRRLNPGLSYPSDPYVETVRSFPSLYPQIMAFLSRHVALEPLHLFLYVLLRLAWFSAVYKLAARMFSGIGAASLACLLVALSPLANVATPLGEDPMIKNSLYQTTLAAPLLLLSMCWFMEMKYARSLGLLGAAFYLNGVVASQAAFILGTAAVFSSRRRAMLKGWLLFCLMVIPWLVWRQTAWGAGNNIIDILRMWYPGHYFPSLWPSTKWLLILAKIPLLAFLFWRALPQSPGERMLRRWLAALTGLWLAGWFFADVWPVAIVVKAQLFRSDAIFCVLGLICGAQYVRTLVGRPGLRPVVLSALLISSLVEVGASVYSGSILFLVLAQEFRPSWLKAAAGLGLGLCFANVLMSPGQPWWNLSQGLLFALLLVSGDEAAFGQLLFRGRMAVAVFLGLSPLAPAFAYRLSHPSLDALSVEEQNWRQAQLWARDHTPVGAVFFVPLASQGFRVYSERSPVVEWTDAAAANWEPSFGQAWLDRISDLQRAESLPPGDELSCLGAKYNAWYRIVRSPARFAGQALYANKDFAVLAVARRPCPDGIKP